MTAKCGINDLMEDMGKALESKGPIYMLGGGNPAPIPEITALWRRRIADLPGQESFLIALAHYETPRGMGQYLETLSLFFNQLYGWDLEPENIAITPGSQSAFFVLFNLFGGTLENGEKQKILFPLIPEYIGYADQSIEEGVFTGCPGLRTDLDETYFRYSVDFDKLETFNSLGALCVSSPTNPSGNILLPEELRRLDRFAEKRGIPFLLDCAYGEPFPGIVFTQSMPLKSLNTVLGFSLSKLGLPSARVGIIIARKEIIKAVSSCNAIISLANGSAGQVLTGPLFETGEILTVCRDFIKPCYLKKRDQAIGWIKEFFPDCVDYRIHRSDGGFFLWIWFRNLRISTKELYVLLKNRKVLIVPGEYFFFGTEKEDPHSQQCIRINFAQDESTVREGLRIIGEIIPDYCRA